MKLLFQHTAAVISSFVLLVQSAKGQKPFCDDGKTGISIDLHGEKDWKCPTIRWLPGQINPTNEPREICGHEKAFGHVCIQDPIDDKYESHIPSNGPHREQWGAYGEYNYLPPGRYVHNLEHGGVVFMYHPCAPLSMIDQLREIATSCLNRHIITAFKNLSLEYPFAVVTYGCSFEVSSLNSSIIKGWVRSKFQTSPEKDVYGNGKYIEGLINPAKDVQKVDENGTFCINEPITVLASRTTTTTTTSSKLSKPKETSQTAYNEAFLISSNSSDNEYDGVVKPNPKVEAKWAVTCVAVLLAIIFFAVWYSKMWKTNYSDHYNSDRDSSQVYINGEWKKTVTLKSIVKKIPNFFKKKKDDKRYKLLQPDLNSEEEIY